MNLNFYIDKLCSVEIVKNHQRSYRRIGILSRCKTKEIENSKPIEPQQEEKLGINVTNAPKILHLKII